MNLTHVHHAITNQQFGVDRLNPHHFVGECFGDEPWSTLISKASLIVEVDNLIASGVSPIRWPFHIGAGARLISYGRHLHVQGFVRPHVVINLSKFVQSRLPLDTQPWKTLL